MICLYWKITSSQKKIILQSFVFTTSVQCKDTDNKLCNARRRRESSRNVCFRLRDIWKHSMAFRELISDRIVCTVNTVFTLQYWLLIKIIFCFCNRCPNWPDSVYICTLSQIDKPESKSQSKVQGPDLKRVQLIALSHPDSIIMKDQRPKTINQSQRYRFLGLPLPTASGLYSFQRFGSFCLVHVEIFSYLITTLWDSWVDDWAHHIARDI